MRRLFRWKKLPASREWTQTVTSRHSVFLNDLVPCVAGQKVWPQREKANKLVSEANKVVSGLDEALLTGLGLKNYWILEEVE
jgi:hypothetical protein